VARRGGDLRQYYRLCRPRYWLFPGRAEDRPMAPEGLHKACQTASLAADLGKRVTVHTLRHSFSHPLVGELHRHPHHPGAARPQPSLHHGSVGLGLARHAGQDDEPTRPPRQQGGATCLARRPRFTPRPPDPPERIAAVLPALEAAAVFRHYGEAYRQTAGAASWRRSWHAAPRSSAAISSRAKTASASASPIIPVAIGIVPSARGGAPAVAGGATGRAAAGADFQVVFTLMAPLAAIALPNKSVVMTSLCAARPRRCAPLPPIPAIWGPRSASSPCSTPGVIHCVVQGGGLSADRTRWIACRPGFFLPVRVLSRRFRRLFLEALQHAFGGPQPVLEYLSRYTHRAAIANSRLIDIADGHVTFRWRDYRHPQRPKRMTLEADEFIRRFLLQPCPTAFSASAITASSPIASAPRSSPSAAACSPNRRRTGRLASPPQCLTPSHRRGWSAPTVAGACGASARSAATAVHRRQLMTPPPHHPDPSTSRAARHQPVRLHLAGNNHDVLLRHTRPLVNPLFAPILRCRRPRRRRPNSAIPPLLSRGCTAARATIPMAAPRFSQLGFHEVGPRYQPQRRGRARAHRSLYLSLIFALQGELFPCLAEKFRCFVGREFSGKIRQIKCLEKPCPVQSGDIG
jgi:hypothetical protein